MVNGPIHEWESDAGTEAGQESGSGRFRVREDARGGSRREIQRELAEAVPALRDLRRQEPVMPSASQWAAFTRELSNRLDEEATAKRGCWRQCLRDRLKATDSRAFRASVMAAAAAVAAAVIAALVWLAGELMPAPAPALAALGSAAAPAHACASGLAQVEFRAFATRRCSSSCASS